MIRMRSFQAPLYTVLALAISVVVAPASSTLTEPRKTNPNADPELCMPGSAQDPSILDIRIKVQIQPGLTGNPSGICPCAQTTTFVCGPHGCDGTLQDIFDQTFPRPNNGECGQFFTDKIAGGIEAPRGSWPWMALLFYKRNRRGEIETEPRCGGSLITKDFVLTAGHCCKKDPVWKLEYVRLGEHDLREDPDCPGAAPCSYGSAKNFNIKAEILHPNYSHIKSKSGELSYNNIALLQLAETVDFQDKAASHIFPVCLPFNQLDIVSEDGDKLLADKRALVTGWGTLGSQHHVPSDVLMQLEVPIRSSEYCGNYFPLDKVAAKNLMCAGGEPDKSTCPGDSGGPLVMRGSGRNGNADTFYQVGVLSFGRSDCDTSQFPGIYVRLSEYLGWIRSVVKNAGDNK